MSASLIGGGNGRWTPSASTSGATPSQYQQQQNRVAREARQALARLTGTHASDKEAAQLANFFAATSASRAAASKTALAMGMSTSGTSVAKLMSGSQLDHPGGGGGGGVGAASSTSGPIAWAGSTSTPSASHQSSNRATAIVALASDVASRVAHSIVAAFETDLSAQLSHADGASVVAMIEARVTDVLAPLIRVLLDAASAAGSGSTALMAESTTQESLTFNVFAGLSCTDGGVGGLPMPQQSHHQHRIPGADCSMAESVRSLLRDPARHTATAEVADHADAGEDGFCINQYLLLDRIGAGTQGEVFLAEDTTTGEARAVKIIRRPAAARARLGAGGRGVAAARSRQLQALEREVAVMRQCRHRNVVALHEVIDDPSDDRMFLVMQYVDQGAIATVRPDGTCSATVDVVQLTRYARQLCAGLQYLHGHGVVHRDIKPDNVLRSKDDTVYLSDFGVAELFDIAASDNSPHRKSSRSSDDCLSSSAIHGTRGTIAFMAPELFSATETQGTPGEAVDVWALGVTFFALLHGRIPFDVSSHNALVHSITYFDPVGSVPSLSGWGGSSDSGTPFGVPRSAGSFAPPAASLPRANAELLSDDDDDPALRSPPSLNGISVWPPPADSAGVLRSGSLVPDSLGGEGPPHVLLTRRRSTRAGPLRSPGSALSDAAGPPSRYRAADDDLQTDTAGGESTRSVPMISTSAANSTRRGSNNTVGGVPDPDHLHLQWQQLLREMLEPDPHKRIQTGALRRRVRTLCELIEDAMNFSFLVTPTATSGAIVSRWDHVES
jgi:serine/threonine protein kinase